MPVADTLLRLAEQEFYLPRWSHEILAEVESTLTKKYNFAPEQVGRRIKAMRDSFPDARVDGYESLVGIRQ